MLASRSRPEPRSRPTPAPTPTRRQPTAARRRQIAEAALDIIATRGVHQLTAMEIARRVGLADGTLFRHFANKQEIVTAAVEVFEALLLETVPAPGEDPLETLHQFFVARLTFARQRPEIMRLVFNDRLAEAAGAEGARRVTAIVERSVGFVRECLERAQREGLVARDVHVQVLTWMVTGVLRGASHGAPAAARAPAAPTSAAAIWASLVLLLRRTAPPSPPPTRRQRRTP